MHIEVPEKGVCFGSGPRSAGKDEPPLSHLMKQLLREAGVSLADVCVRVCVCGISCVIISRLYVGVFYCPQLCPSEKKRLL